MLQTWHISKRIQCISTRQLTNANATFTRHRWFAASKLIVGTQSGDMVVLENCEQVQVNDNSSNRPGIFTRASLQMFAEAHKSAIIEILVREAEAYSFGADGSVCHFALAQASRARRSGTAVGLIRQFRLHHSVSCSIFATNQDIVLRL